MRTQVLIKNRSRNSFSLQTITHTEDTHNESIENVDVMMSHYIIQWYATENIRTINLAAYTASLGIHEYGNSLLVAAIDVVYEYESFPSD